MLSGRAKASHLFCGFMGLPARGKVSSCMFTRFEYDELGCR